MWQFHFKSLEMLRPSILALVTKSIGMPLTTTGSKEVGLLVLKFISSSLHFVSLSWKLSSVTRLARVSTAAWMWLSWFLLIVSEIVVSSTYFQRSVPGTSSSLIMMINSHGPSFVPWGTPAGTAPHSEKQSWPSLTRCLREVRKLFHVLPTHPKI